MLTTLDIDVQIPHYIGLSRTELKGKAVVLFDDEGHALCDGLICNTNPLDCVDNSILGAEDVGVIIMNPTDNVISRDWENTLHRWPLSLTKFEGHTLAEILLVHHNATRESQSHRRLLGKRQYNTANMCATRPAGKKIWGATEEHARMLSAVDCCSEHCCQVFPRPLLMSIRKHYFALPFNGRKLIAQSVFQTIQKHEQNGRDMVIVEGRTICIRAWMNIYMISRAQFNRNKAESLMGIRSRDHGNTGTTKPRANTVQARATLGVLVEGRADAMPHMTRTLPTGEKIGTEMLPVGTTWCNLLQEVNNLDGDLGYTPISTSTFSRLHRQHYKQYVIKSPGDNFSRCGTCAAFKDLLRIHTKNTAGHLAISNASLRHLTLQEAHRNSYYKDRILSKYAPNEVLCIIHDKMDYGKTALPVFAHKNKRVDKYERFPISIAGMIAHGHSDVNYAHYVLDMYPSDANFTITSIMKLLCQLEVQPVCSSRDIPISSIGDPLHDALVVGVEKCSRVLPLPPPDNIPATGLPPLLLVQMDNCAKDNKSKYNMLFWSALTAKGIFREVRVSFLIVGHTHEDVDAMFGRFGQRLKIEDCHTLPDLMASFMAAGEPTIVPSLIHEVADFKEWVKGYYNEFGQDRLIGHSKAHQFRFYVDPQGVPLMQYKVYCTDPNWVPDGGIALWNVDPITKKTMFPTG